MKIFNIAQIQALDAETIKNEPIPSIDLMERAARSASNWISDHFPDTNIPVKIFVGPGNNGGDGLAIATHLDAKDYVVHIYICEITPKKSADFQINLDRLPKRRYLVLESLHKQDPFPDLSESLVIDAIFGSGLSRPVEGYWSELINQINTHGGQIISIDIPSGMFADQIKDTVSIQATHTITFQMPKLAFFFRENCHKVGNWHILDIGLSPAFIKQEPSPYFMTDLAEIRTIFKTRSRFDHKGMFGHALLICGGYGKIGAAILAAKGCLRSGAGLLTVHIPKYAYQVLQTSVPEAMVEIDRHEFYFSSKHDISPYSVIGIGCGLGQKRTTEEGIQDLLENSHCPLVLDADAINILARNQEWLDLLPANSVLTPHPGEFRRLVGASKNSLESVHKQIALSKKYNIVIVLKGAFTSVSTPEGSCYFNTTGNPGMATGGSGDVLTGIITGLIAQDYSSIDSALLGVYLHGLAGDMAVAEIGENALIATDIVNYLGKAICTINAK